MGSCCTKTEKQKKFQPACPMKDNTPCLFLLLLCVSCNLSCFLELGVHYRLVSCFFSLSPVSKLKSCLSGERSSSSIQKARISRLIVTFLRFQAYTLRECFKFRTAHSILNKQAEEKQL